MEPCSKQNVYLKQNKHSPPSQIKEKDLWIFHNKRGHMQKGYPSLLCYSKAPLPLNDSTVREVLIQDMTHLDKYTTHVPDTGDSKNIVKHFPIGVEGVVHQQLLINNHVVQRNSVENMCLPAIHDSGSGNVALRIDAIFSGHR
jgi:hypothetical protein